MTNRGYISLNINYGLLGSLEYIQRAERADCDGNEPFNSAERSSATSKVGENTLAASTG